MNILYISNLSNNIDAGLNYSVPAGINVQQHLDNVLWIDLNRSAFQEHWGTIKAYHNIREFKSLSLNALPVGFNHPDVVVFEGFYYVQHVIFARQLRRSNIPYIIIPRGSFTKEARRTGGWKKRLKKNIAHLLLFDTFIKKAKAIQFLTEGEKQRSKEYGVQNYILPNGVIIPKETKVHFSSGVRAVFIGRLDIYTKGLDLLLDAIKSIHLDLAQAGFILDIYGAPRYDCNKLSEMIKERSLDDIVVNHAFPIKGKEKEKILLSSDVFILTSRTEGHPVGLIEAFAYGLPALVSEGTNMAKEVENSNSGWTCDATVESVTQALKKMIKSKESFSVKGKNALELAKKYDWNYLAKTFHNTLYRLLYNPSLK